VALVGNSGGGKSTVVSLLPRFYNVTKGAITIDGVNIEDFTLKSLRDHIAVVFQDNFLFSGTIRDNILIGRPGATEADLKEAVKTPTWMILSAPLKTDWIPSWASAA
jgi:subfamily B ATP-binding cassette protein MsbA